MRKLAQQNGLSINKEKVTDINLPAGTDLFGHLLGKTLLQRTTAGVLGLFRNEGFNLFTNIYSYRRVRKTII